MTAGTEAGAKTVLRFPSDLVEQNADRFTDETVAKALEILEVWDPSESGKAPSGVAATAVYTAGLVTAEAPTQQELSDIFGTSPMTIRKQQSEAMQVAGDEDVV